MQNVYVNCKALSTAFINGCFSFVVCLWVSSLEDGTLPLPTTSTPPMSGVKPQLICEYLSPIFLTFIPGKTCLQGLIVVHRFKTIRSTFQHLSLLSERFINTVEPRYNDLRYNDIPDIIMNILCPGKSYSNMYGTEPRYNYLRCNDENLADRT